MPLIESCSLNYFVKTFHPARLIHPARLTIFHLFLPCLLNYFPFFSYLLAIFGPFTIFSFFQKDCVSWSEVVPPLFFLLLEIHKNPKEQVPKFEVYNSINKYLVQQTVLENSPFKLKILKYPKKCRLHATLILRV